MSKEDIQRSRNLIYKKITTYRREIEQSDDVLFIKSRYSKIEKLRLIISELNILIAQLK